MNNTLIIIVKGEYYGLSSDGLPISDSSLNGVKIVIELTSYCYILFYT